MREIGYTFYVKALEGSGNEDSWLHARYINNGALRFVYWGIPGTHCWCSCQHLCKYRVFSATPSGMPTSTGENTNFEQPPLNLSGAETQFKLGQAHRLGVGVPRSFEQAFAWIQKSVGKGFAEAQNMLGFMYSRGEGTPQSLMKLLGTEGSNITFEGYASLTQPQNDCSERRMDIGLYKTNNNTPRPLICRRLAQTLGLTLLDLTLV